MNNKYKPWTEEETNFLIENYHNQSSKQISQHIGRPVGTVSSKAAKLNLKKDSEWSDIDIEILKNNYYEKTNLEIQKLLSNRTISSISTKAQELGILKSREINRSLRRSFKVNQNYFEKIDSHRKAYWLGWIWGDGSIARIKNALTLSVHYNDTYILEYLKKDMESEHLIKKTENMSYIRISSFKLKNDLQNLNIFPNKSYRQDTPNIPNEFINSFILGLFEADGYVGITKQEEWKSIKIEICGTKTTCAWLKNYLDLYFNKDFGKVRNCSASKIAVRFSLSGKDNILDFYNLIYKNVNENILDRKQNIFKSFCDKI